MQGKAQTGVWPGWLNASLRTQGDADLIALCALLAGPAGHPAPHRPTGQ
jgi:hypothetical protein